MKKFLKRLSAVIIILLALYGSWELLPFLEIGVRSAMGFPSPMASGYYRIGIDNASASNLLISVHLLNDTPFHVPQEWERRQKERVGWLEYKKVMLPPQRRIDLVLPSQVELRIGYVLVVAVTDTSDAGLGTVSQKMAAYLWRWTPEPCEVRIEESDLRVNDLNSDVNDFYIITVPRSDVGDRPVLR